MEIIDVVLHSYNFHIMICSIVCFYNVQNKSSTSVISLIKYGEKGTHEWKYDFVLNYNNYEIKI